MKPCYHCHQNPASHGSNFCSQCSHGSRPLFFPAPARKSKAFTALLYMAAAAVLVGLAVKTAELVLAK